MKTGVSCRTLLVAYMVGKLLFIPQSKAFHKDLGLIEV